MSSESSAVLSCSGLQKSFAEGDSILHVLSGVEFNVAPGERIAIIGASGAGKTTLLQLLGGLDLPTSGQVMLMGQDLAALDDGRRGLLRNESLGFVYQFHHLLPEFSALENVAMPLLLRRQSMHDVEQEAAALLARVGLQDRLHHRPGELSGGERQRAAVARALVTKPAVVLADEPTGNLDTENGEILFELMLELNADAGCALVVVTHDIDLAQRMDRQLTLAHGVLSE